MLDPKTSAKATILAVDDSPIVLNVIRKALGETYTVVTTSDPTQALSMLYHQSIALLLLDVTMPGIDGLELCRTIRNLPQFVKLPIVMLTARDGAFDRVQGRRAGASEYLTKPFDDQVLLDVAARFIPHA
jgi:twitching motility two-component system response regulator PilG